MTEHLEVKMLGTPAIILNGANLSFPYRQTEALLYYLLVNKRVSKLTLADIIWGDKCTEEKISSNLRNAFYILRKFIGKDFLEKNTGNQLTVSSQFEVHTDVEDFLNNSASLTAYKGDFLEGFYLKNNTLYNEWLENTRQLLKNLYMKRLLAAIPLEFDRGCHEICEDLCEKLLKINEFDETAYKFLMEIYKHRKNYTMALKIYGQLEELFERELFEKPGEDTQRLAASIEHALNEEFFTLLKAKKDLTVCPIAQNLFFGRAAELDKLSAVLTAFHSGDPCRNILITGEAGIGKSSLAERLLHKLPCDKGILILKTRCYFAEEKYILKPWQGIARSLLEYLDTQELLTENKLLLQGIYGLFPFLTNNCAPAMDEDDISTLDYKSIQSVFTNALLQFSHRCRVILYIDDLQWADETSLSLIRDLSTCLNSYKKQGLLLLMTCRSTPSGEAKRLLDNMFSLNGLEIITLNRFDYQDTVSMASLLLPTYPYTQELQAQLFHETEGNPLFITEAVNHIKCNGSPNDITPNMQNIIEQRLSPVSKECCQILNLVSIFFDGVTFECLSKLSHKEDYELAEILEYLLSQNLLKEAFDRDNTFFTFTHQKIAEYVYEKMSWTKRRILHDKAGLFFEGRLKGTLSDMALYPKLIYHFDKSSNQQKYLKYAIKYLYNYLNVTHEFFPVIENNMTLFTLDMQVETRERLTDDLGSIENLLSSIENCINDNQEDFPREEAVRREHLETLSDYLHMTGRHYIRACSYEKGLHYILKLKHVNNAPDSPVRLARLLQANRQLMCIYINRYEPRQMTQVVEESLALLQNEDLPEETAVWKRLQGLSDIMAGRLEEGIFHLEEAIAIFTNSTEKEKHLYNLAAAYSWIGEALRHSGKYKIAGEYYEKAIDICSQNYLISGVSIFYAYAGMAAFDSGSIELAKRYLETSKSHYEKGNLMWGRSLPYSYYSLLLLGEGRFDDALKHLETALHHAQKLESKYELGIVYRIITQIKSGRFDQPNAGGSVSARLEGTLSDYVSIAKDYLDQTFSPVDEQYMAELLKE